MDISCISSTLTSQFYKRVARSLTLIKICDNLVVVLCTTPPTDASLRFLETTTFIHIFAIVNGGGGFGGGWTFFSKEEGGYFTHIFVVTVTSFKMTCDVFYNEERGNKFPAGLLLDMCSSVLCWRVTLNRWDEKGHMVSNIHRKQWP